MAIKEKYNAHSILSTSVAISILLVASSILYYLVFYLPARDNISSEREKNKLPTPTLSLTPTPMILQKIILSAPQQTATPTSVQKTAVFLTLNSKTYYCRPEGIDAIKSADSSITQALTEYKTCLTESTMAYASCTRSCSSDECNNSCKDKYYYEKWCKVPDDKVLVNLLNQYCK